MPSKGDITLDRYEILKPLGQGGMGEVFLARDTLLDRQVALKFLSKKLQESPTARARFLREAKSAAGLDHPFICKVYEAREADGKLFIAMEYVAGETLQARLCKGPLSVKEAVQVATEIAEALEVAHDQEIVHRDLKPSNVMITKQGHAKVMDFGLAKQLSTGLGSQAETYLTQAGAAVGTLAYMSPEQARGDTVDLRSDIFSFGVLVQEMLSAKHPFQRASGAEMLTAILRDPPPPLPIEVTKGFPRLDQIVRKTLAKDASERYPDMKELASDLRDLRVEVAPPGCGPWLNGR